MNTLSLLKFYAKSTPYSPDSKGIVLVKVEVDFCPIILPVIFIGFIPTLYSQNPKLHLEHEYISHYLHYGLHFIQVLLKADYIKYPGEQADTHE